MCFSPPGPLLLANLLAVTREKVNIVQSEEQSQEPEKAAGMTHSVNRLQQLWFFI